MSNGTDAAKKQEHSLANEMPGTSEQRRNPLSWSAREDNEVTIDDFLEKYPPSKQSQVTELDDGRVIPTPWVWIHLPSKESYSSSGVDEVKVVEEGEVIMVDAAATMKRIKEDDSIPVRASKKNPNSKKVMREKAEAEVRDKFKELGQKHNCLSGKWLFYADEDRIDGLWKKIGSSIGKEDGALRTKTKICTAKVSTTGVREDAGKEVYVICAYIPDSWDKEAAYEACNVFIKDLMLSPNSFKADVYTLLGINSNNDMGIKSTIYSTNDVMPKKERDEWFEKNSKKQVVKQKTAAEAQEDDAAGAFEDSDSDDDAPAKKKVKH